jgi:2-haloacid dehalogenase
MQHSAYVFDAYGTLFDVHSAVSRLALRIGPDASAFSELWRSKQLEYSWVHTLMGAYRDFWQLTADALDFALTRFPSVDRRLRSDLLDAYRTLHAFPEVPAVLQRLRERGVRLAILSNGSPDMLDDAVSAAKLDALLDKVFSIDGIGIYKTHPDAYRLVTDHWDLRPEQVSFQSSNRWDIAGAARFGFATVWVNRSGQPDEYPDWPPDRTVKSLSELLAPGDIRPGAAEA